MIASDRQVVCLQEMTPMKAVQSSLLLMVLGGALFCTYSLPAAAGLSHAGYTGLISTPTPAVEPDGRVSFLFSWIGGNRTYLFSPKINRVYAMTMGLLPGLEVTFRQTQVIGWHDPDAPGIQHSFDRMGSAKYQLPLPKGWPRAAIGIQDFASAGALVGMGGRLDQRGLTTTYAACVSPLAGKWRDTGISRYSTGSCYQRNSATIGIAGIRA